MPMRKVKINKVKNEIKEKAFAEFKNGKFTQRDIALKYGICETELSRFFSNKMSKREPSIYQSK